MWKVTMPDSKIKTSNAIEKDITTSFYCKTIIG